MAKAQPSILNLRYIVLPLYKNCQISGTYIWFITLFLSFLAKAQQPQHPLHHGKSYNPSLSYTSPTTLGNYSPWSRSCTGGFRCHSYCYNSHYMIHKSGIQKWVWLGYQCHWWGYIIPPIYLIHQALLPQPDGTTNHLYVSLTHPFHSILMLQVHERKCMSRDLNLDHFHNEDSDHFLELGMDQSWLLTLFSPFWTTFQNLILIPCNIPHSGIKRQSHANRKLSN
jgi:hypothetical protein